MITRSIGCCLCLASLLGGCSQSSLSGRREGGTTGPADGGDARAVVRSDAGGNLALSGTQAGPGTGTAFDPRANGSDGVALDPSGAIVLGPASTSSSASLIWVANSDEGTISKVDTRQLKELARYRTGPALPDPSRTTVSLDGDVVVANRHRVPSATKIAADPSRCTGSGRGSSTSGTDLRDWGDDRCVLWHTPLPDGSTPRAAAFDAEEGPRGELSAHVWIGLYDHEKLVELDATTGAKLGEIDTSPVKPYGMAVDGAHNLWVVSNGKTAGKLHIPTRRWTQIKDPPCSYGIAVDPQGRVWTSRDDCVARYSPTTDTWDRASVGSDNKGLAIDASGSVWIASGDRVIQAGMETMTRTKSVPLGASGVIGMAVDFDGMIWAISQDDDAAIRIHPTTYATDQVPVGRGPYTYSDMTGFQLRNAAGRLGSYRQTFTGCTGEARWERLSWTVALTAATSLEVRARTADDAAGLATAPWVLIAKQPTQGPPADLALPLGASATKPLLQVELRLRSSKASETPILSRIEAQRRCPGAVVY
ncbi:MAG: hypothetical protein IPG96_06895 [Proteobacteria bacterium]|nr:hypothetical protein [Pseudomonadota bacterium]